MSLNRDRGKSQPKQKRECIQCGKEFYVFYSEIRKGNGKYCSKDCFNQHKRIRSANKLFSGEVISCANCGKYFVYKSGRTGKKYCSQQCRIENKKLCNTPIEPVINKIREQKKVSKTCPVCSSLFVVYECHSHQVCCSVLCSSILRKTTKTGCKNSNWKGGIKPVNSKIRSSDDYAIWRTAVFERDNYICALCGQVGNKLHAHHIYPFATHKRRRFKLSNGVTVCEQCHKKLHGRNKEWVRTLIEKGVKERKGILQNVLMVSV